MKLKKGLALRYSKGFTLIELLVVVAIIGLLSAVVLTYLSSARKKGNDTAVKSNLTSVRTAADIYYLNNNNSYLSSFGSPFGPGVCPATSSVNTALHAEPAFSALRTAIGKGNQSSTLTPVCYLDANSWAVVIALNLDATKSWCVDSKPSSKLEAYTPANALDATTHLCK
jgi:prepilin-type N-terminal cleavage/methylation domain-containing protein